MTSVVVVLGGYAVFPSTLEGIGSEVILVKKDLDVADVFGSEVSGDDDASCLGRTAAWAETAAKAIVLRRMSCILTCRLWNASMKMDKPWQSRAPSSCTYLRLMWRRLRIETARAGVFWACTCEEDRWEYKIAETCG